jgi:hypothetical protein
MRFATRISYTSLCEPHNGLRRARRACEAGAPAMRFCAWWGGEGAARGAGAPQATEPPGPPARVLCALGWESGSGAEPRSRS